MDPLLEQLDMQLTVANLADDSMLDDGFVTMNRGEWSAFSGHTSKDLNCLEFNDFSDGKHRSPMRHSRNWASVDSKMKPTLYLDSTVPSYFLAPSRNDPLVTARHIITCRWWEEELPQFEVRISQVVLDELGGGDPTRAQARLGLVEQFLLLDIDDEVERVAAYYVSNFAMPRRNTRDAFHLAVAAVHDIEYLVTWNFAHLANASKRQHIETLNRRLHLPSPVICSPEELFREPDEAD